MENQNIEVQEIIRNLPDELPIIEASENVNSENNSSEENKEATSDVNNKSEEAVTNQPKEIAQVQKSEPIIEKSGNVQLATSPVVNSVVDAKAAPTITLQPNVNPTPAANPLPTITKLEG